MRKSKKLIIFFSILILGLGIEIFYISTLTKPTNNNLFVSSVFLGNYAIKTDSFFVRFKTLSCIADKKDIDYALPNRSRYSFVYGD